VLRIKENKGTERRMERIGRDKRKECERETKRRREKKERKRRKIDTREYRDARYHARMIMYHYMYIRICTRDNVKVRKHGFL